MLSICILVTVFLPSTNPFVVSFAVQPLGPVVNVLKQISAGNDILIVTAIAVRNEFKYTSRKVIPNSIWDALHEQSRSVETMELSSLFVGHKVGKNGPKPASQSICLFLLNEQESVLHTSPQIDRTGLPR